MIRSLRARSLRSAIPASFLSDVFWSTSCPGERKKGDVSDGSANSLLERLGFD